MVRIKRRKNRGGRNRYKNRRNIIEVNEIMANLEDINSNSNSNETNETHGEDKIGENKSGV